MQSKHQNQQNTLKIHFFLSRIENQTHTSSSFALRKCPYPHLTNQCKINFRPHASIAFFSVTLESANKTEKGIPELLVQLDFPRWNSFAAESDWNSQHIGFVWKISRGILCQPGCIQSALVLKVQNRLLTLPTFCA